MIDAFSDNGIRLREIDRARDLLDRAHAESPQSTSLALWFFDTLRRGGRHTERPWRSVTGREGIGKDLIDLPLPKVEILSILVPPGRRDPFLSVRGAFHVRPPSA